MGGEGRPGAVEERAERVGKERDECAKGGGGLPPNYVPSSKR